MSDIDKGCVEKLEELYFLWQNPNPNTNPFNLDKFELYLRGHPQYEINIDVITNGYPLHLKDRDTSKLCKTVRNHCRDKRDLYAILKRMVKEARQGQISGTDQQMHYTLNLLCVPKKNLETNLKTEVRVARHGSYHTRDTVSINDVIDPLSAKIESLPNIRKYIELLIDFEYVSLRDLKDAFRQLGLAEKDSKYIQYCVFGLTFKDNRQAYGVSSAAANCQHFAEMLIWIVENKFLKPEQKQQILVHIDDFIIAAHSESECIAMTNNFDQMCSDLNVKISHEKDENWIQKGIVHGFGFDLASNPKLAFIPEHKFKELIDVLILCLTHRFVTGEALESICGKIMHWSQFRKYAKVLCYRMLAFIFRYIRKNKHLKSHIFYVFDELAIDMRFWLKYCWYLRIVTMESILYTPSITVIASSDACDTGAGFVIDSHWAYYDFSNTPNKYGKIHSEMSINYQEAHAVLMLVNNFRHTLSGRTCLIFVDNKSVLWSLIKNWSTSSALMEYIQEIVLHLCIFRIGLRVEFIPTEMNGYSDALSRGQLQRFHGLVRECGAIMDRNPTPLRYYSHLKLIREGLQKMDWRD